MAYIVNGLLCDVTGDLGAHYVELEQSPGCFVIPEGVVAIDSMLMLSDAEKVHSLSLPATLRSIGSMAFEDCVNLRELDLPQGITTLEGGAFSGCTSLERVSIPASLTGLDPSAFNNCPALTDIDLAADHPTLRVADGCLYSRDGSTLICYPACPAEFVVPDGVTRISDSAFADCEALESITLPDSLVSIGDAAFFNCANLADVELPDSVEEIGDEAFRCCDALADEQGMILLRGTLHGFVDEDATALAIPYGVTAIGSYALEGMANLQSVDIPDTVVTIGTGAFSGCESLVTAVVPINVAIIGDEAFSGCTMLESVTFLPFYLEMGKDLFDECPSMSAIYGVENSSADINAAEYQLPFVAL